MNSPLNLKSIFLNFLNRVLNPNFENKAIGAFLLSGFALLWFSQPLSINGRIAFDLGFVKADLGASNDPNWSLFWVGIILLCYGGFALYKLKISPSVSRRSQIGELILMMEKKQSSMRNVQIQQFFLDLFKIKAAIPVIKHLLAADDPIGQIYDYRYAGHYVELSNGKFEPKSPPVDHTRWNSIAGFAYYIVSGIAVLSMAAPLFPSIDTPTKLQLSVIGFPAAIGFGLLAAILLNSIRAHSAAIRLLAAPAGDSEEKKRDAATLRGLLSEIYTPTFDSFIYYGRLHCIYDEIIHFWEGYRAKVEASNFHINNPRVRDVVMALYTSWGKSLSFASYFVRTNNMSLHKFDNRRDIYRDADARAAYDAFAYAIESMDENFRELLKIVREDFRAIDIEVTNAAALNDFRSYQIEKS